MVKSKTIKFKEKPKIELSWKQARDIAQYYEIPITAFFVKDGFFDRKVTRNQSIQKKSDLFDELVGFFEDKIEELEEFKNGN